jgi:hypothetical protein
MNGSDDEHPTDAAHVQRFCAPWLELATHVPPGDREMQWNRSRKPERVIGELHARDERGDSARPLVTSSQRQLNKSYQAVAAISQVGGRRVAGGSTDRGAASG